MSGPSASTRLVRGFRQVSPCSSRAGFSRRCTFWTELTDPPTEAPDQAPRSESERRFIFRLLSLLKVQALEGTIPCSDITDFAVRFRSDLQVHELKSRRQQPTASPALPLCKIVFSCVLIFCQGIYYCRTKIHHGTSSVLTVGVFFFFSEHEVMKEKDARINRVLKPQFSAPRLWLTG